MGKSVVAYLLDYKVPIVVGWIILTIMAGGVVQNFMSVDRMEKSVSSKLDMMRVAVPGSEVTELYENLKKAGFQNEDKTAPEVVGLACKNCKDIRKAKAMKALSEKLDEIQANSNGGIFDQKNAVKDPHFSKAYLSKDSKLTLFYLSLDRFRILEPTYLFLKKELDAFRSELAQSDPDITIYGPVGVTSGFVEIQMMQMEDAAKVHMGTCPFILAVFYYMVPSWRLAVMLLPLIATSFVLTISMVVTMCDLHVLGSAPLDLGSCTPMASALCLIFCTDFALFMSRRLMEEVSNGVEPMKALEKAHAKVGPVIVLSATLLIIGWTTVAFLPQTWMSTMILSMGLSGTFAVMMSTCMVLLVGPCLIGCFGIEACCSNKVQCDAKAATCWTQLMSKVTCCPIRSSIVILLSICGLSLLAKNLLDPSFNMDMNNPNMVMKEGHPFEVAASTLRNQPGIKNVMGASIVLVEGINGQSKEALIAELCNVGSEIEKLTQKTPFHLSKDDIIGWAFVKGKCISKYVDKFGLHNIVKYKAVHESLDKLLVKTPDSGATDKYASYLTLLPDAKINNVRERANELRSVLSEVADNSLQRGFKVSFGGEAMVIADTLDKIGAVAPHVLGAGALLMMLVVAVALGTAFMPFKLAFTVILPIAAAYGVGMLVFPDPAHGTSILAWTGIDHFVGTEGIPAMMPFTTFGMLMALAMDYELFLFCRILEFREEGWTNQASALMAVAVTGPTISASAIIMTLVFGASVFGNSKFEAIWGVVFGVSVCMDAFFVRSVLEPCVLAVLPAANYWPRKLPEPKLDVEHLYSLWDEDKTQDATAKSV